MVGRMSRRGDARIQRQWRIVVALHATRRGHTIASLIEATGASRASIYRDVDVLREAGVQIVQETQNGEERYRLLGDPYPAIGASSLQVAALRLAARSLSSLRGSSLLAELEALVRPSAAHELVHVRERPSSAAPEIVAKLDATLRHRRRARILYRSRDDAEARWRLVDGAAIHVEGGELYLVAYAIERSGWRLYKLARIADVEELHEPAADHGAFDVSSLFERAVGVWNGPGVDVAIRIAATEARFVREWPLVPEQRIEEEPDGAVVVHATVAGLIETKRWFLSWGRAARVLSPPALQEAVRHELVGALAQYTKPIARPGAEIVSHDRIEASATVLDVEGRRS